MITLYTRIRLFSQENIMKNIFLNNYNLKRKKDYGNLSEIFTCPQKSLYNVYDFRYDLDEIRKEIVFAQ